MQPPQSSLLILLAAIGHLPGIIGSASATSTPPSCGLKPGIIESTQGLLGDEFIGKAVSATTLLPKVKWMPNSAELHADGGNTNTVDYPGPLGQSLNVTSLDVQLDIFYWDAKGTMFAAYGGPCNDSDFTQLIAVLNPETLSFEAVWQLPAKYSKTQLNTSYMQLLMETDELVVSAMEGQIYILHKSHRADGSPSIRLRRLIDLTPSGVLKGNILLNTVMDAAGNVWFSTGAVDGVGSAQATKETIVGYVEQDGTIHSLEIPNQTVGQGIAVTNTTIFLNTEPSARDDHANAVGFLSALQPGPGTSVNVVWNATYDAGSSTKDGAFGTRGSGTTPTLLGNDFVAICDNADVQINLLIYPQNGSGDDLKPICTMPLFRPNASWTDNGVTAHYDGKHYGVIVQNMDHENAYDPTHKNINGPYNNLTSQSPGISKFFVAGDGSGCHLDWSIDARMTTVPILSTATGLIYGYEQSNKLAKEGEWIWYATATDYYTGKTVWKARTGAGGPFNNYFRTTFLKSGRGTIPDGSRWCCDRERWRTVDQVSYNA